MNISCLWQTSEYRGDHSADLQIAVEVFENETVKELMSRILKGSYVDYLELRLIQPESGDKRTTK